MKSKYLIFLIIIMGLFLIVSCAKDIPLEEDEILEEEVDEEIDEEPEVIEEELEEEPIVEEEEVIGEEEIEESTVSCDEEIQLFLEESIKYEGSTIMLQSVASDAIVLTIDGEYGSLSAEETKDFDGLLIELNSIFERTDEAKSGVVLIIPCEVEEEETIPYYTDSFGNAIACDETAGIKQGDSVYYNDIELYLDEFTSSEADFKIDGFTRTISIGETSTSSTLELTLEAINTRSDPSESYVSFSIAC